MDSRQIELLRNIKTELDSVDDYFSYKKICSLISRIIRITLQYTLLDILEVIYSSNEQAVSVKVMDFSMDGLPIPYDGQPSDYGIIGWCVQDEEPKLVRNLKNKPQKITNLLSKNDDYLDYDNYYPYLQDTDSELVLPIKVRNKVIGVINVETNDINRELVHDFPFFLEVSKYISQTVIRIQQLKIPELIEPNTLIKQQRYSHLTEEVKKFIELSPFEKNVMIIMRFSEKYRYKDIERIIKQKLNEYGLKGFTAKDREYSSGLWDNICVYMLSCKYAIAVIENIEKEGFNPNVILEVGFMDAWGREILLLKDDGINMFSDINYRLYQPFSSEERDTIGTVLDKWLKEKIGMENG